MKRALRMMFMICFALCVSGAYGASVADTVPAEYLTDTLPSVNLKEFTIVQENVKRQGNRDIITVTNDLRKGTNNTAQLMGRLPGFRSNFTGTELKYLGSSNIIILVDSLEKDAGYIMSLDPKRFYSIDVIHNPTGKYRDYEVLVNLRTKRNYEGVEVYADGSVTVRPGNNNGPGNSLAAASGRNSVSYTRDKLNYYIFLGTSYSSSQATFEKEFKYPLNDYYEKILMPSRKNPNNSYRNRQGSANGAVDYQINKNHSLSLKFQWFNANFREVESGRMETGKISGGKLLEMDFRNVNHTRDNNTYDGSLFYRGKVGNVSLSSSVAYMKRGYETSQINSRSNDFYMEDRRHNSYDLLTWYASAYRSTERLHYDLSYWGQWSDFTADRLSTGKRLSSSIQRINTLDGSLLWAVIQRKLLVGVEGGISSVNNRSGAYHDSNWVPRAGFQIRYFPSSKLWLRLRYETKTEFASAASRLAYGQFTDSLMWTGGNPDLKSYVNHNLTFTLGAFNILTFRCTYNYAPKFITSIYEVAEGMRPDGTDGYYVTNTECNTDQKSLQLAVSAVKWWNNWQVDATVLWQRYWASYGPYKRTSQSSCPMIDLSGRYYNENLGFQAELNYTYGDAGFMVWPQQWHKARMDMFKLSVSKSFFNGALRCFFEYTPPVHLADNVYKIYISSPGYESVLNRDFKRILNNQMKFTVIYRFSSGKQIRHYDRSTKNDEQLKLPSGSSMPM